MLVLLRRALVAVRLPTQREREREGGRERERERQRERGEGGEGDLVAARLPTRNKFGDSALGLRAVVGAKGLVAERVSPRVRGPVCALFFLCRRCMYGTRG